MREILFRGKRKDNREWVYGDLVHSQYKIGDTCVGQYGNTVGIHQIDPETVGQYTGLTDKNGTKIFEGDILHIVSYTCDYDYKTSVAAKYGYVSGLYVDGDFDGGDFNEIGFAFDYWSEEDAEVEVIGNIHDNPELLGGAE